MTATAVLVPLTDYAPEETTMAAQPAHLHLAHDAAAAEADAQEMVRQALADLTAAAAKLAAGLDGVRDAGHVIPIGLVVLDERAATIARSATYHLTHRVQGDLR